MTLLELLATGFLTVLAIAGVGMCVVLAWVHVRMRRPRRRASASLP